MACQAPRQRRADNLTKTKQRPKPGAQQKSHQQPSLQPFRTRPLNQCLNFGSRQLNQTPIVHPRRTSRLAGSTGKASIQVESRGLGSLSSLKQLLNEIDASARPVQLVSEQLIGRAGRRTKTAMNAFAEYLARLLAKRGALEIFSEFDVHGQSSGKSRPGFRMPAGSNAAFSRRLSFRTASCRASERAP